MAGHLPVSGRLALPLAIGLSDAFCSACPTDNVTAPVSTMLWGAHGRPRRPRATPRRRHGVVHAPPRADRRAVLRRVGGRKTGIGSKKCCRSRSVYQTLFVRPARPTTSRCVCRSNPPPTPHASRPTGMFRLRPDRLLSVLSMLQVRPLLMGSDFSSVA